MMLKPNRQGLGERIKARRDLAEHGLKVDILGRNTCKITRNGRYMGLWREAAGAFLWQPASGTTPERRVMTADEAIRTFERDFNLAT